MKSSVGVVYKRRETILNLLREHPVVEVQTLASRLNVSEVTIRRDLQLFEDEGVVERFYGGAKLIGAHHNNGVEHLRNIAYLDQDGNYEIKDKIARQAFGMVEDGQTVFVNSGSTALMLLKYLFDKQITIITNNGKVIHQPKPQKAELIVSGGEIFEKKQSLIGDFAMSTFREISANICFLGVGGINDKVVSTYVLSETAINRTILERTNGHRVIIAEGYKVGRENNFTTSETRLVTHLITDQTACAQTIKSLRERNIEVTIVDALNEKEGE